MAGFAGYTLSDEILNLIYRGIPIGIEGNLYLRLLVAPSSRAGGGTETNYGGYSRLALLRSTGGIWATAPANGRLTNAVLFSVGTQATTTGNGTMNSFDIVDTPSGAFSKLYNGGPILTPKVPVVGKVVKFRAGALVITF